MPHTENTPTERPARAEHPERAERRALLTEQRRAERSRELVDLQRERPEVVQAYAPADFAVAALRWAV